MLGAELGDNVSIELFPVLWKHYIGQDYLQRNRYLTNHRSLYSYLWVVTSDTVHRCWSVSVHSYRSKLQPTMRIILFSSWSWYSFSYLFVSNISPAFRSALFAFNEIVPTVFVDFNTTRHLPKNALRLSALNRSIENWLPLSTPAISACPSTSKNI